MERELVNKLPSKAHELIRLALRDLEKTATDDAYVIAMDTWHQPEGDQCWVCLAGSVMAQTMQVPPDFRVPFPRITSIGSCKRKDSETGEPLQMLTWPEYDAQRLIALDNFRRGWLDDALDDLRATVPQGSREYRILLRQWEMLRFEFWHDKPWTIVADTKYEHCFSNRCYSIFNVREYNTAHPHKFINRMNEMADFLEFLYNEAVKELQL